MVCPTICGKIWLARLQVRTTCFSLRSFIISIFFNNFGSTKGPFFSERPIPVLQPVSLSALAYAPSDNIFICALVAARLFAQSGLAPRTLRPRQTDGLGAFAATMGM